MQTNKKYTDAMELFFVEEFEKNHDEELEIGRLPRDFIDRMLRVNIDKTLNATRVNGWKVLDDEVNQLKEMIRKFWHLLNCNSDIKQCEVSYVDENGKWYALAPESQWNADYLLHFAQEQGFDVQWLIDERYKKIVTKGNVIPFRNRAS